MRIEGIFPSYFSRIPPVMAFPGADAAPPQNSLYNPPIVVDISPEGREAYNRYKTNPLYNPLIQADAAQRSGMPGLPQPLSGNGMPGRDTAGGIPGIAASGANEGVRKAADVFEPHVCQTCKNRKYQDSSSDPSVSFQAPTHISPGQAGAAVASHEGEHVAHEQAKAEREDKKIVSQTVSLQTSICPECGRVYISGGVTRTITASKQDMVPEENNP